MSELLLDLKGDLRAIAEVIGRQKALYLVGQCPRYKVEKRTGSGQLLLYIPQPCRLRTNHKLVNMLGYADAMKLCTIFGGELLVLSQCRHILLKNRNEGIRAMLDIGFKIEDVARYFELHPRTVKITACSST